MAAPHRAFAEASPVCVVGLGHVGLPLAVWWAEHGTPPVVGFDRNERVLSNIRYGRVGPEPGLADRLRTVLDSGQLTLMTAPPQRASVVALCVPTPLAPEGTADLRALDQAVAEVAPVTAPGALWLLMSTVPVGTTVRLAAEVRRFDPTARVAMCPERVWPGHAFTELASNPRVVGGVDDVSTEAARAWFVERSGGRVRGTSAAMAELAKLIENASRDAAVAVAHAAAELALDHHLDPYVLRDIVNAHPRVELAWPGIGIGGHCLPVDPWFLTESETPAGALFAGVRRYADGLPDRWVTRIEAMRPPPARLAVLGLAYKPEVADLRNAPALSLARSLARRYDVVVTDPLVEIPADLNAVPVDEALEADVIVHAVAHGAFRWIVDRPMRADQVVIDACGGWWKAG